MEHDELTAELKALRVEINGAIKHAKVLFEAIARGNGGREVALGITKL
jgi:hypothetical protein